MVAAGFCISTPRLESPTYPSQRAIPLSWIGELLLTVIGVLWITNAFNVIAGLDGIILIIISGGGRAVFRPVGLPSWHAIIP